MMDIKHTIEVPCLDKGVASHSISSSEVVTTQVFQYYANIHVPFCVGLSKES